MKLSVLTDIIAYELKRPDDAVLKETISNLIISARATLIRQQFVNTKSFSTNALLNLCVPLETVDSAECCGENLGCKFAVSEQIPVPIDVKDEINFNFVGSIDGLIGFGYIKPDEMRFIKYRKFSKNLIYYTWMNRRIMIVNKPSIEQVKVRYVPMNPLEFLKYNDCEGKSCFNLDDETFIEDTWEDAITRIIIPKLKDTKEEQIKINENDGV